MLILCPTQRELSKLFNRSISTEKAYFGDMRPFTITPSSALIQMKFRMIHNIIRFSLEWRPGVIQAAYVNICWIISFVECNENSHFLITYGDVLKDGTEIWM